MSARSRSPASASCATRWCARRRRSIPQCPEIPRARAWPGHPRLFSCRFGIHHEDTKSTKDKACHCEEQSDEAIPTGLCTVGRGLLRFARNDSLFVFFVSSWFADVGGRDKPGQGDFYEANVSVTLEMRSHDRGM